MNWTAFLREGRPRTRFVLVTNILLAALACSFASWDPLEIDDRAHIRLTTLQAARSVAAALAHDFRGGVAGLRGLAGHGDASRASPPIHWDLRSEFFLETHPDYMVLEWIDPDRRARGLRASDRGVDLRELDFATHEQLKGALATAAITSADAVMSPPFVLPSGRTVAAVVVPIRAFDRLTGFVGGVFDTTTALELMLRDDQPPGFELAIEDDAQEIYRTSSSEEVRDPAREQHADLTLAGVTWRVHAWPRARTVEDMRSAAPELAFILTTLLALNFGTGIVRARKAPPEAPQPASSQADASPQNLPVSLLRAQDEERRRIARELHDSTTQTLGAAAMALAQARGLTDQGSPQLEGALRESAELLEAATLDLRTRSYLLHPPTLEALGLEYALVGFAEGFAKRSGLTVRVEVQPDIGRFPTNVELALFRVAQEALTNIYRHSGSSTAEISLRRDGEWALLEIADCGRGMAPGAASPSGAGVGLASMRARVGHLGGSFDIVGRHPGTALRVALPLATAGAQGNVEADENHL